MIWMAKIYLANKKGSHRAAAAIRYFGLLAAIFEPVAIMTYHPVAERNKLKAYSQHDYCPLMPVIGHGASKELNWKKESGNERVETSNWKRNSAAARSTRHAPNDRLASTRSPRGVGALAIGPAQCPT